MLMEHPLPKRDALAALLRHVARDWARTCRSDGTPAAMAAVLAAMRGLAHPAQLARLLGLEGFRHVLLHSGGDVLFPLSHNHFLLQGLSATERMACAIEHFSREQDVFDSTYLAAVYGGDGWPLWTRSVGDATVAISLRSTPQSRHEGPVSIVVKLGGTVVHEISFAWVEGRLLDASLGGSTVLLVTRNQSARAEFAPMVRFRALFPQNAPSYFAMAALLGLAEAHGLRQIAGIGHRTQISYESAFDLGFRRSYSDFWANFGAVPIGAHAHLIDVPPRLPPIESLAGKHRGRARARREQWAAIQSSSSAALRPLLRHVESAQRADTAGLGATSSLPGLLHGLFVSAAGLI